jgi:phage N-6-adenine-methyltransferase
VADTGSAFLGINALFGPLVLDLFADDDNAKCPAWYTAEDNALTQDWSERLAELGGAGYGNPPYSRSQYHEKQAITGMTHIMNYAAAQREKGGRYVFLIKAAPSETAGRCRSHCIHSRAHWVRSACVVCTC